MSQGHNQPQMTADILRRQLIAILTREGLTTAQKLVGVAIIAKTDDDGRAEVSTTELRRLASLRDRETVYAATSELADMIIKERDSGKRNAFRVVLPPRVAEAVEEAFHEHQRSKNDSRTAASQPVGLNPTSTVEPDRSPVGLSLTSRVEPDQSPVGLNPTSRVEPDQSPVGLGPTGQVEPDGSRVGEHTPAHDARVTHAGKYIKTPEVKRELGSTVGNNTSPSNLELPLSENRVFGPDASENAPAEPKAAGGYTPAFEEFWSAYPDKRNNSKSEAFAAWKKLSAQDRLVATASLAAFAAFCKANPDYRVLHAERYLKYRRFEGYAPGQSASRAPRYQHWWQDPNKVASVNDDGWRQLLRKHLKATENWPVGALGPDPHSNACLVPKSIIAEFRLREQFGTGGIRKRH